MEVVPVAKSFSYDDNEILVRKIKRLKLTIVFWDTETIYVLDENTGVRHIFHRWFMSQRGFYTSSWLPFREDLKKRKGLDIMKIYRMANYYGIAYSCDFRPLNYKTKDARYIHD